MGGARGEEVIGHGEGAVPAAGGWWRGGEESPRETKRRRGGGGEDRNERLARSAMA